MSFDSHTTQLLVKRVQDGDAEALEVLCERYLGRVLAAVRARLGQHLRKKVESWDLVQEAMLEAFRKVDVFEFRTEGAFLKYVNRVVENQIRDEADRWKAQKRAVDREVPLDMPGSDTGPQVRHIDAQAATPSQIVGIREDLQHLEIAMDQLAADDRELVVAVKLEGRTYREIAADIGRTPDAVRMQVNRALAEIAGYFERLNKSGGES